MNGKNLVQTLMKYIPIITILQKTKLKFQMLNHLPRIQN